MEAFLVSMVATAFAEVGDKSQLLALMLGARFRRSWLVVLGILAATLLNHGLAAALGGLGAAALLGPEVLRWGVGLAFVVMAGWTLIPEKEADMAANPHYGVFGATFAAFFLAEMGDKTQVATVALAAQFQTVLPVVAGTTLGMMIVSIPVVFLGERLLRRIPVRALRAAAALLFAALGAAVLLGLGDAVF